MALAMSNTPKASECAEINGGLDQWGGKTHPKNLNSTRWAFLAKCYKWSYGEMAEKKNCIWGSNPYKWSDNLIYL